MPDVFSQVTNKGKSGPRSAWNDDYDRMYQFNQKIEGRYDELLDPNSPLYQQYKKYLQGLLPNISPNSLLAPLAGSGFGYGTSQKIATERGQQINTQRGEMVNRGVQEFALGNQSQANALLGILSKNRMGMMEQIQQNEEFKQSQPSFWDSLLNIGMGIGGFALGGPIGGLIGFGAGNAMQGGGGRSRRGDYGLNEGGFG